MPGYRLSRVHDSGEGYVLTEAKSDSPLASSGADAVVPALDPWNAAMEQGTSLRLSDFPSVLFLRVANVVHQEASSVYSGQQGLTLPEWRILGRLHESAPIKLSTLCRVAFIDKAQVTRILKDLSARGLAETRPDPSHRHRRIVEITEQGRSLAERIFVQAEVAQKSLLGALTPEERRLTHSALCKILAHFDAALPSALIAEEEEK